tara:strand:+ start:368 stop:697 length:330 start_codon:yes stop_codon:yes gene_type:complete
LEKLQKWLKFKDMRFIKIINDKRFTLLSIFLFLYVIFNLIDGERGLISYIEKKEKKEQLIEKKESLITNLETIEKKNDLLTNNIDLDYLEILYREKFMVGKKSERIFIK